MLTPYEEQQLTSQGPCYIHFHPSAQLNQTSALQLQESSPVAVTASGTALTAADDVVSIDPAGGTATLILPPALKSKEYHITMVGTGTLTITPTPPDTVLGTTSIIVEEQWTSLHLKADTTAANWILL